MPFFFPKKILVQEIFILCASYALLPSSATAEQPSSFPQPTLVARSPDHSWRKKTTRTLAQLTEIPLDPKGSRYGGLLSSQRSATGFFRTEKINGRWWLVDPEGHLFIHRGVTSIKSIRSQEAEASQQQQFGTKKSWANSASKLLLQHGFNGLGPWCEAPLFPTADTPLVYTKLWNFMSAYGKQRGGTYQASGHTGYPADCPFIFDPEFPAFCMERAQRLSATKDDPWLLGHFTDNELPWRLSMLENYLGLPPADPGYKAAAKWLTKRRSSKLRASDITDQDREDFVAFAADTYFTAVTAAIRKHDPNHLILGARFHGHGSKIPSLHEAAGRHLDVISINYYHAWTPDPDLLAMWTERAQKPILITEWYAKAEDSGLGNTSGAGWLVKTQKDRAAFYQNFTLGLLESRACVGWHWFRYSDNDPNEKGTDPSNRDANKGIVTNRYQPYQELLSAMKDLNQRTFGIIQHFDRNNSSSR